MGTHPIFESDFDCLTEISQDDSRTQFNVANAKKPNAFPTII